MKSIAVFPACWMPGRIVAFAMLLLFAACGTTTGGGGGAGAGTVGGKPDSACNEVYGEGCYAFNGQTQREACTGGKWTVLEVCAAGTVCQEKITVAGQPGRTTECKVVPTSGGQDASSGGDSSSGEDGSSVGDASGSDSAVGDTGGNDTAGDTGGGKDTSGDTGGNSQLIACAQSLCADQWATCLIDTQCQAVLTCFTGCTADAITCASTCQGSGNEISLALLQCAQTNCVGGAVCGNGKCESGESATCPGDCSTGPVCGNGTCEAGETSANCATDCPVANKCGNGVCDSGETPQTCIQDCTTAACCASLGYKCGDVVQCAGNCGGCSASQTCNAATHKCVTNGPVCGNGTCESGETTANCALDCPAAKICGDLTCQSGETSSSCPLDCPGTNCDNGICSATETATSCPQDCDPATQCMLNYCQSQWVSCVTNSACASILSCVSGCATGDTTCAQNCYNAGTSGGKTALTAYSTCFQSNGCGASCGNGTCDSGETTASCPADCPADPGCTAKSAKGCGGCSCEATVCASDSYCCNTAWDSTCVSECVAAGTVCP